MSTNRPASRAELKSWCLRRLGAPVLEINVADDQLEDLIDMALQYFWQFHGDGSERMMLKTQFTQQMRDAAKTATSITGTDFSTQNTYIEVPDYILGINDVHTQLSTANAVPANIFNIKYQIFLNLHHVTFERVEFFDLFPSYLMLNHLDKFSQCVNHFVLCIQSFQLLDSNIVVYQLIHDCIEHIFSFFLTFHNYKEVTKIE